MGYKIAVVGTHGSGKTTLCYEFVSELKKLDLNVGLSREVARDSPYLIAKEITPDMQMDIFGRQIVEEMTVGREYDLIVCDRSVLDIYMYMNLFFPDLNEDKHNSYESAMRGFSKEYMDTYDLIFRTTHLFDPRVSDDSMRPEDIQVQQDAHSLLEKLLVEFDVDYTDLPREEQIEFMIKTLENEQII